MNCPSQAPQTGPGSSQSTILIGLRQRLGDHLLGTRVPILIVHVVPPYVLSQGFPSHPPVRVAGQAPLHLTEAQSCPSKHRFQNGDLGFRLQAQGSSCCLVLRLPLSEVGEMSATPASPAIIREMVLFLLSSQVEAVPLSWSHSFRVHWREKKLM